MGKRGDLGYYPTDPYAVEGLRVFWREHTPVVLRQPLIDPCAGYGALLSGLLPEELRHLRYGIEIQPRLKTELARRVDADKLVINSGLDWRAWPKPRRLPNVVMNPPFDNDVMTAFVTSALEYRQCQRVAELARPVVAVLSLSTWWHSDKARAIFRAFGRPDWTLAMGYRITCDGGGVGDMRTHEWLVWDGSHADRWSRCLILPRPVVRPALIAEHKRLSHITGDFA